MALKDSIAKHARKRKLGKLDIGVKPKKPGYFDLGTFAAKVKAREVDVLNEFAWFSESAQAFQGTRTTMDIVREFLLMIDCDLELLMFYIEVFNEDQEALLQVVFALDNIFVRFQDDDGVTNLRAKILIHAQRIISQHGPQLAEMLGAQGDPVIMKPILKLMTSLILIGPEVADVFMQSLDLSFFNSCFARVKITETVSIRTCAQYLLIALLVISRRNTLWRLVENRSIFPWAFAGLVHDKATDVIGFLQTIKEKIVENTSLSKNQKINVLNKITLTPVMALLIWKGQLEWRGKEWSRVFLYQKKGKEKDLTALMRGNELLMATPADRDSVRSCAASFLSSIIFNSKQGIAFRDPRLGLGERNCNFMVTQVVASCSQVFSEQEGANFMADLLIALPDQIKYIIVDRYFNFGSAKLSRTHHYFYDTLAKVVSRLDFDRLISQLEPTSTNQYVDLIRHFCLYQFVPSDFSEYCLTSIYSVLHFLNAMLKTLVAVMKTLDCETRRILVPFLKHNLMSPTVLAELLKRTFDQEEITNMSEHTGANIADFVLKVLDTLTLLASPLLGYMSANTDWSLMEDVDRMIKDKVAIVSKSKIYLRLMEMIFSFLPDFEEQLVNTNMQPLRLLFGLLAEASTEPNFQLELVTHAIGVLKKISRLARYDWELEQWMSTVLASDKQEINQAYCMALCDAIRDTIVKGAMYENEIQELVHEDKQRFSASKTFSSLSAHMVSLDSNEFPVFTAVMREILHSQTVFPAYIKFLQKYGGSKLDLHFSQYINFLSKGEKPFVNKGSLNVTMFSSETAMQLETAFVASMTGGHPKSMKRVMVKIRFTGEDSVNVSLLNQLIFIIRWCQKHNQVLFVNPVASCLNNLSTVCDKSTIGKLSEFISCNDLQSGFCANGNTEITLLVLTIVRRVTQLELEVGFDITSLKYKALDAVFKNILEVLPFMETFKDTCTVAEISAVMEFIRSSNGSSEATAYVLKIMTERKCKISAPAVKHLVEVAQRDAEVCELLQAFFDKCPMHSSAVEVFTLCRLIEAQLPLALTILRSNPCLTRAVEKNLMSLGELKGSNVLYSLELLQTIALHNKEAPSKEISDFIKRSLVSVLRTCLQEEKLIENHESIADKARGLLDYLRDVVAISSKDYGKLLKTVLPHTDKPNLVFLVLINAILEHGDFSEDCLIAVLKCLIKLSVESEANFEARVAHSCSVLLRLPDSAWKIQWIQQNFEKTVKGLLRRAFVGRGTLLTALRVVCEKVYRAASPSVEVLTIVEMVFGHSQVLPVLTGKDCPLKQELAHLLVALTSLDPRNVCKTPHVPILLSGYTASLSVSDQHIFHLMSLYEKNGANLALLRPLIWGVAAPAFYTVDKGTTGVSVLNNATVNQVLSQISQKRSLQTVEQFPGDKLKLDPSSIVCVPSGEELYDVRFILTTVYHLLDELTEVQTLRFVEEKVPLLAMATLSADCDQLRGLGYTLLSRIYSKLERVSAHPLVMYMIAILDMIRNSLGSEGTRRISTITMGYLTKSCDVIIGDPHNPLYNQLIRSTLCYPAMNLDRLPLMVQHFLSSSTASRERRIWLENLLGGFVTTNSDFEALYSHGLFDKITMFSLSTLSDREETANILRMVQGWLLKSHNFKRFNIIAFWLTQLIRKPEFKSILNNELLDFLDILTLRLSEHKLRRKELFLLQDFVFFHVQVLQLMSEITPDTVTKFNTSFGRVVSFLSGNEMYRINANVILVLIRMTQEVGLSEANEHCLKVLQKWTPLRNVQDADTKICVGELWLEALELLFAKRSSDIAWNISSLEMVHRSLKGLPDLRRELLESTILHEVVVAMSVCAETAPLLVIEIFEYLKGSCEAMQGTEYQEVLRHLSSMKDEPRAVASIALIQEAWLGVEKPKTAILLWR